MSPVFLAIEIKRPCMSVNKINDSTLKVSENASCCSEASIRSASCCSNEPIDGSVEISQSFASSCCGDASSRPVRSKLFSLLSPLWTAWTLIPLILLLPPIMGINGVWIAFPIADFLAILITGILVYREIRKINNLQMMPGEVQEA